MSFFLRWMVRPVAFLVPLAFVATWCGIAPGWSSAALMLFCMVWANAVRLFEVAPLPAVPASRRRTGCAVRHWDFTQYEAAMAIALTFLGRAVAFIIPVLVVARLCGASMGWNLLASIAFCVAWEACTDRIGHNA